MKAFYLDIGNTSLRMAEIIENGWDVIWHQRYGDELESFLGLLKERTGVEPHIIYVSSVRKDIIRKLQVAAPDLVLQVLSTTQIPDYLINYSTVESLGIDRFLGCLGAYNLTKGAVIVIDTGSACTVDFMDEVGVYQGGVIMPGIDILKKSVRRYLPELPEVEAKVPYSWPGKSTQESLQWGVNGAFKVAIESWVQKYKLLNGEADVFITGGNSADVQKLLKPETLTNYQPELQFEGMKAFVQGIMNRKDKNF